MIDIKPYADIEYGDGSFGTFKIRRLELCFADDGNKLAKCHYSVDHAIYVRVVGEEHVVKADFAVRVLMATIMFPNIEPEVLIREYVKALTVCLYHGTTLQDTYKTVNWKTEQTMCDGRKITWAGGAMNLCILFPDNHGTSHPAPDLNSVESVLAMRKLYNK